MNMPANHAKTDRFRLFVGLVPDVPTRRAMASRVTRLRGQLGEPRVRWVRAARYHATLVFLGDHDALPPAIVAQVDAAVRGIGVVNRPWVLDHATSFPGRRPPWILRSHDEPAWLRQAWQVLYDHLTDAYPQLRIDARFVPHVTVAYSSAAALADIAIEPLPWSDMQIALLRSHPGQPDYDTLATWPLTG